MRVIQHRDILGGRVTFWGTNIYIVLLFLDVWHALLCTCKFLDCCSTLKFTRLIVFVLATKQNADYKLHSAVKHANTIKMLLVDVQRYNPHVYSAWEKVCWTN